MIHLSFYLNAVWGLFFILSTPNYESQWAKILGGLTGASLIAFAGVGLFT